MTKVGAGVGHSRAVEAAEAGREAARAAREDADGEPVIAYAFGSSEYDQEALVAAIDEALPCPVLGSSTAGEIVDAESFTESVAVLVLGGDVAAGTAHVDRIGDPEVNGLERLGRDTVNAALSDLDVDPLPAAVLRHRDGEWNAAITLAASAFGDGFFDDKGAVLAGMQEVLGTVPVAGGWAGDDWKYEATYTYGEGEPRRDALAVGAISGVTTGVGSATGLQPTGRQFTVTETTRDGRVVTELDGQPALEAYREAFGDGVESFQFLLTKPMGYDLGGDEPSVFVPGPSPFEEDPDTALHVTAPVEEGWEMSVLDTSREAVLQGARDAVGEAMADAGHPEDVAAVLVYDCMCRWYHLSDVENRTQEAQIVRDAVGQDVPMAGFYSYGEIHAPGPRRGARNQSIVVQVLANGDAGGADGEPGGDGS